MVKPHESTHSKWGLPNSLFLHHRSETTTFLQKIGEISPPRHLPCLPSAPRQSYFFWTQTALPVPPTPSPPPGSWTVLGKLQKPKDQPQLGRSLLGKAVSLCKKSAYRPSFWIFPSSGQFIIVLIHFLKYIQACTPYIAEQARSLTEPAIRRVQREPAFPSIATYIWTQLELEHQE